MLKFIFFLCPKHIKLNIFIYYCKIKYAKENIIIFNNFNIIFVSYLKIKYNIILLFILQQYIIEINEASSIQY